MSKTDPTKKAAIKARKNALREAQAERDALIAANGMCEVCCQPAEPGSKTCKGHSPEAMQNRELRVAMGGQIAARMMGALRMPL